MSGGMKLPLHLVREPEDASDWKGRPWWLVENSETWVRRICKFPDYEDEPSEEFARLIQHAVNSHSRLVEALEAARKRLAEIPGEGRLIVQINEALADVKEPQP